MSHFTVMVKVEADNLEAVESIVSKMLEPYSESLKVEPRIDKTFDEVKEEFDRIKDEADNWPADKEVPDYMSKYVKGGMDNLSVSDWAKGWYEQEMDEDGNLLTTYNPESKWDWFEIGGRWHGKITMKDGSDGGRGEPSWGWEKEDIERVKDRFDIAFIKDIDFDKIIKRQAEDAGKFWDETIAGDDGYYKDMLKKYNDRDDYIAKQSIGLTSFSVLDSMGWHEASKMGWFGMSHDENEDENVWDERFMERFLTDYTDNTAIAIVDCHI